MNTSNEVKIDQNGIEKQGTKKCNSIGNIAKPKVYLHLMRNVTGEVAKPVPMVDAKLVGETDTVSWSNLQKTNSQCQPWIYSVREVDDKGIPYVPKNFISDVQGMEVTNTYIPPKPPVIPLKPPMPPKPPVIPNIPPKMEKPKLVATGIEATGTLLSALVVCTPGVGITLLGKRISK